MLSGETSTGKYPLEAVRTMDAIARDVEASRFLRRTPTDRMPESPGAEGAIWRAAVSAATDPMRPLMVFTWSGQAALFASKARLAGPVFALSPNPAVVDRLAMVWGITSLLVPPVRNTDDLFAAGEQALLANNYVQRGEEIVIVTGETPIKGATHLLKIARVGA
jgi:pyruvate kinase